MGVTLETVERDAMTLHPEERAILADKLWGSVTGPQVMEVVMTSTLSRLLDEGLEGLDQARTTEDIRGAT